MGPIQPLVRTLGWSLQSLVLVLAVVVVATTLLQGQHMVRGHLQVGHMVKARLQLILVSIVTVSALEV